MAERLRLVNLRWPKPPALLADLAVTPQGQQLSRDTFTVTAGDPGAVLTTSPTRWGGQRTVGELRGNATISVDLLIMGDPNSTSPRNSAIQRIQNVLESALASNLPDLAVEWRPDGASYSTYWRLRGPVKYGLSYNWAEFSSANLYKINVAFPVAPTAEGAPYDIFDDFSSDTVANGDWITDGGVATLNVVGGHLVPSQVSTTPTRYRHARGYVYGDVEVFATITTGSTLTGGLWAIELDVDTGGADTALALEMTSAGFSLVKYVAGVRTSLSTAGTFAPSANTSYYLLLRRAGNVIYWRFAGGLNWSEYSIEPQSYTLVGSDLRFASYGHVGLKIAPASTGETYDDVSARPWVYRGIQTPEQIQMLGPIVGEAPMMADIEVTPVVGASTSPAIFGKIGWCERPQVQNYCTGGNLGDVRTNGVPVGGWVATAVSGVIGASTQVARNAVVTPTKYGASSLNVTCPATTDTGASFLVSRRFKRGRVYAACGWFASTTATTLARLKLGVSGDLAVETAQALTAGWKFHAVTWQPTADHDGVYVASGINAATASVFDVNGVNVVESPTITLAAAISSTTAATMPIWYTPTDIPGLNPDGTLSTPFLAFIDLEIIRVTAINGTTCTIDRGQEGTTAATHAVDTLVVVLPPSRQQYEGKGAQAPFGVLEGEYNFLGTIVSSSSARGGAYVTSAGGWDFLIDPSAIPPDDFAQNDVLVMLWARLWLDPAGTGMVITPQITSSEKYDPTLTTQPSAGVTRYTLERGSAGFVQGTDFTAPVGTGGTLVPQYMCLGTLPMVSDRARPQRWKLTIGYSSSGGASPGCDYAEMGPNSKFISTMTGLPNDSNYASFVPNHIATLAITKTCRADGSGLIRVPRFFSYLQADAYPDAGLGQSIDLPNADCDLTIKLSNLVPNDPTSNAMEMFSAEPFWTAMAHIAGTPRFTAGRGA